MAISSSLLTTLADNIHTNNTCWAKGKCRAKCKASTNNKNSRLLSEGDPTLLTKLRSRLSIFTMGATIPLLLAMKTMKRILLSQVETIQPTLKEICTNTRWTKTLLQGQVIWATQIMEEVEFRVTEQCINLHPRSSSRTLTRNKGAFKSFTTKMAQLTTTNKLIPMMTFKTNTESEMKLTFLEMKST